MKYPTLVRQNGALFLLAVLVIAGLIVFAIQNQPAAVVSGVSKSQLISLPVTLTSMDVGTNAPWLQNVQVPVTGLSQQNPMDAGANAPWLEGGGIPVTGSQENSMDAGAGAPNLSGQNQPANNALNRGDRDVHYTPVPPSSELLSGGGR